MIGKARCPASCGEIVQGMIKGRDFLVTCPVALYSTAQIEIFEGREEKNVPAEKRKAWKAVRKLLDHWGFWDKGFKLSLTSQIPVGKGLSSSTADIVAACFAAASALNREISSDLVAEIALSIEPSDGVMYEGCVIFDHRRGTWRESLGPLPPMSVYIVVPEEEVDTVIFNSRKDLEELNKKKEPAVEEALYLVRQAFVKKDLRLLGEAMVKSAVAHQAILEKPFLGEVIALGKHYGAVGVNVAHSGSAVGLFFEETFTPAEPFFEDLRAVMRHWGKDYKLIRTEIENRGPRIL
ncbi:MAG: GHMP kinase [Bacillota bacterium]